MSALRLGPAASSASGFIGPFAPRCAIGQVCGQNPAYDFFPSQHQIFYRAKGKGQMWYDPVFKVVTVEGKEVRALLFHEIVFRTNVSRNDRALLIRGICLFSWFSQGMEAAALPGKGRGEAWNLQVLGSG